MFKHEKYPWMMANIDRKVVGQKKGLECKTADKFTRGKWGEDGSDDVPDHYRTQSEHYMIVTGLPEWDLAVLIGGNEYRQYHLQQDKELSEMLIEQEAQFWDAVEKGIPPMMDYDHPGTLDLLKRVYPGTNGETITLDESLEHWHKVKLEADEICKTYSAVSDGCKARIAHALGENACGIIPGAGVQYKRSLIKRKEFTVAANEYITMRASAYKGD
jgi:predicted phage-related endonuclease